MPWNPWWIFFLGIAIWIVENSCETFNAGNQH